MSGVSHPSRVRGLKLKKPAKICVTAGVAPLAGAWIETKETRENMRDGGVAPLAGAWIETSLMRQIVDVSACRTPRGCVD